MSEKLKVLMEKMLGKPDGPASLGTDGKLADNQIPGLDKIGAAPAGYGLGMGYGAPLTATTLDTATRIGWYYIAQDGNDSIQVGTVSIVFGGAVMRVDKYKVTTQTVYLQNQGMYGYVLFRYHADIVGWSPWEWVNPPMKAGVEYRTTERYMSKPVYVKLVSCGTGPDNTTKEILHVENPLTIVDYNGGFYSSNGDCLMIGWENQSALTINHSRIKITTAANYSAYTALVWMKYTKSTD